MDTDIFKSKGYFLTIVGTVSVLAGVLTVLALGGGVTELGYAIGGGIGTIFVVLGAYTMGRRSGHPHSHAVAEGVVALGGVYLFAVAFRLLTEYGERSFIEVMGALITLIVASFAVVGITAFLGRYNSSPN